MSRITVHLIAFLLSSMLVAQLAEPKEPGCLYEEEVTRRGCTVYCINREGGRETECHEGLVCHCKDPYCMKMVNDTFKITNIPDGCSPNNPLRCETDESGIQICHEVDYYSLIPEEYRIFHPRPSNDYYYDDSDEQCLNPLDAVIGLFTLLAHRKAYCLAQLYEGATLRAGTLEAQGGMVRRVKSSCTADGRTDLALIVVDEWIDYDDHVQPACFPTRDISTNEQALVVGLGLTNQTPGSSRGPLQVLPVKRQTSCDNLGEATSAGVICFRSSNDQYRSDACAGDRGAPVYAAIEGRQTIVDVLLQGAAACKPGESHSCQYLDVFSLKKEYASMIKRCVEKSGKK